MVVCKCRKATRNYCYVHDVPVCGECICFPEHQVCVVKKYADWVVNADYDWPPKCSRCNVVLEAEKDETIRLGCLDIMHTKCFITHIQSYPTQTAPAEYICPACSTPIWPPASVKDAGSLLHNKLKEAIIQTGMEKNVFGNHLVTPSKGERGPPPAFASDPLSRTYGSGSYGTNAANVGPVVFPFATVAESGTSGQFEPEIVEIGAPSSVGNHLSEEPAINKNASSSTPGATARKAAPHVDRQSEVSYFADDEDGNSKKYTKRGSFRHRLLRLLLPFWSSALPTLPVTAPTRKNGANDVSEGGRARQQRSKMDPRKILLTMAIVACLATMAILYYRLAQRSFGDNFIEEEQ